MRRWLANSPQERFKCLDNVARPERLTDIHVVCRAREDEGHRGGEDRLTGRLTCLGGGERRQAVTMNIGGVLIGKDYQNCGSLLEICWRLCN